MVPQFDCFLQAFDRLQYQCFALYAGYHELLKLEISFRQNFLAQRVASYDRNREPTKNYTMILDLFHLISYPLPISVFTGASIHGGRSLNVRSNSRRPLVSAPSLGLHRLQYISRSDQEAPLDRSEVL